MKKLSLFVAFALGCVLILAGCTSKAKMLEGKWKIDTNKLPAAITATPQAAMVKSMLSAIVVEIKSDNTFAVTGGQRSQQGTWKMEENTVTLTPVGTPNDKPSTATLSDDGKSLSMTIPNSSSSVTFVKESS